MSVWIGFLILIVALAGFTMSLPAELDYRRIV